MKKRRGVDNAQSLFGLNEILCDNQILLAFDGTEYFCSKSINCPHCNRRNHRDGSTTYYHQVMTPVIVAPDKKQVINLEPEFIRMEDGKTKQDCENAAVKRWLSQNPAQEKKQKITFSRSKKNRKLTDK